MAAVKRECVYVISAGPRCHKIGITHDLIQRVRTLQTAHSARLTIVDFAVVDDMGSVEHAVHSMLAPYRLKGEWFEITAEQALEAVREAARPAAEIDFKRGELVRCIENIDDGVAPFPTVGKIYTVRRVHIGGHLDLLWLPNTCVAWNPGSFARPHVSWDPGDVI